MPIIEKGRQNGDPVQNMSLQDSSDTKTSPIKLQAFLLARRFSISAPMAEALAPLVYGSEVWR
jgi:hypothetical protein